MADTRGGTVRECRRMLGIMTEVGDDTAAPKRHVPGTRVEVRTAFDGTWARGFEVVDFHDGKYQISRRSDGMVLPVPFEAHDVRREHRNSMWWM